MPKGDPAGYLPSVKKARKGESEPAYKPRSKRPRRGQKFTQSTPGGSYDGRPAEDDPRFDPKKHGNKRAGGKYRGRMPKGPAFNQKNEQNV